MSIPQILKENRFYTRLLLLFGAVGLLVMSKYPKGAIVVAINGHNTPFLDVFFKYITYLGDGFVIIPVAILILLFKNRFHGILTLITYAVNGLIIQLLKHSIYKDMSRPYLELYKNLGQDFHEVAGVTMHSFNSFPSGHSSSAFTFFMVLTFISKEKKWGMLFFIIALTVAFSRVYLFQHFFMDIYAGMMYAFFITLGIYHVITKKTDWQEKLNTPLIKSKK